MKNIFYTFLLVLSLSSCSEFQKALKSEDIAEKFRVGTELYEQEKYGKANRLFAQIIPQYRGKPQAEKLTYMYAKTYYEMGDYHLSGYQFERFETAYPRSEKAEEASFLSARSYYMLSPVYSKEQKETVQALDKLQIFLSKYPDSEYLPEVNKMVKELDYKLEKKAFEIAKQYNQIAYFDASDYEASIKSFDNFLLEYPGSTFREEAMYYRLDSAYRLAINSMQYKKEARLMTAQGYYNSFIKYYSDSKFAEEANRMNDELTAELNKFETKS
ncbi:outer membrane protein assembly factor BamD [Mangrovimonas sp. TPBH4]|uniref:outer membrane protein assembly factor BamD n=1 Tax=Mangrovimonas sp. TPBH4 TaxID=1645914 RepID=UPI0006B5C869|nr:outer membrane protein assembly factor BamD [Mangrovimonas sp. TPBH4]